MTRDAHRHSPNFRWFLARYPAFLYIDRLAVAAPHRRRGVGAALYAAEAERAARELRVDLLCCEVNTQPPNPESLAFHLELGFAQVGEQEANGKGVAMLTKKIPSPAARERAG